MTAHELIAQLASVDLDRQSTIFAYLADHFLESRLMDGSRLLDQSDMMQWLRELSHAARMAHVSQGKPPSCVRDRRVLLQTAAQTPRRPYDESCPRCGHVHQGISECGEQLGGGRICRCEMEVHA